MKEHNTIKLKIDPSHPPIATAAQRQRLKALADLPDARIDLSDDPESPSGTLWTRPGALVPASTKQLITLRLDSEVIQFFKATGARYQTRINAALREYIKHTS